MKRNSLLHILRSLFYVLLLSAAFSSHAQSQIDQTIDPINASINRRIIMPASSMLEGPWQLTQEESASLPDVQAREAVAKTLGLMVLYQTPPPTVLSINVMGRTANARIQVVSKEGTQFALVQLRLQMNSWVITDIIPQ